jgi:hypothetical protein
MIIMADYYTVEPEVAGELGPGTVFDRSTQPVSVTQLEYIFGGWLGDSIVESTPCFLVTAQLGERLVAANLGGMELADVSVTVSPEGEELSTGTGELPEWRWLKITGVAGDDDFGMNDGMVLVVSARALDLLRESGLNHADVEEA